MDKQVFKANAEGVTAIQYIIQESLSKSFKMRINPGMDIRSTVILDKQEIAKRKSDRCELSYIAEGLIDLLNSNINMLDDVFVTDEEGYVIFVNRESDLQGLIKRGSCLSTINIGTNAVGLAIQHRIPVEVNAKEHYLEVLKNYHSVGIPIIRNGQMLGCAGIVSSPEKVKMLQPGVMEFLIQTAISATDKMLETRKYIDELYMLKEFLNNIDNSKGVIIVASDYKILQVNTEAESVLAIDKAEILGTSIKDLIDIDLYKSKLSSNGVEQKDIIFKTSHGKVELNSEIERFMDGKGRLLGWKLQFTMPGIKRHIDSRPSRFEFKDILGKNKEFVRLIRLARAIAPSPSNVMITGESGTGKELFAQAIHYASYCKDGPFIAINCAAIPRELIETELFGYVDGAFTGARRGGMEGKFVQANGGSIFLDEIGDMPLELQSKLLRVLQERLVVPVGGNKAIPIDIRVISATNRNLEELIESEDFRADLFYRLNVINLRIPPLREHKDDIELLSRHFVSIYASRLNKRILEITPEALDSLQGYNWPGNIRELQNVMEMAVNLSNDTIDIQHLPSSFINNNQENSYMNNSTEDEIISLEEMEKRQIVRALSEFGGNISRTANVLEIGRTTLYRKIKKYSLLQYVNQ